MGLQMLLVIRKTRVFNFSGDLMIPKTFHFISNDSHKIMYQKKFKYIIIEFFVPNFIDSIQYFFLLKAWLKLRELKTFSKICIRPRINLIKNLGPILLKFLIFKIAKNTRY